VLCIRFENLALVTVLVAVLAVCAPLSCKSHLFHLTLLLFDVSSWSLRAWWWRLWWRRLRCRHGRWHVRCGYVMRSSVQSRWTSVLSLLCVHRLKLDQSDRPPFQHDYACFAVINMFVLEMLTHKTKSSYTYPHQERCKTYGSSFIIAKDFTFRTKP